MGDILRKSAGEFALLGWVVVRIFGERPPCSPAATALAIIGLYGSLAHLVQLRQREIGIRVALGALRWQVVRMILARAGLVCGAGLMAGVIGATVAGRAIRQQLFGVQLTDAASWIGVLGGIVVASAVAAYVPAWRAAKIEPAVALRHE